MNTNQMNTEEIIQTLGGFGRFQKLQYFFFCILWIGCGAQALLPVFLLYLPPYRCAIPSWPNDTFQIQDERHAACLNDSIPLETDASGHLIYSHCHVFNRNDSCAPSYSDESTKIISDDFPLKRCKRWVYDTSLVLNSAATQMNFVCDELVLVSVTNMVYIAGLLIGSFLFGILSDRKGRKLALTLAILIMSASMLPLYFVNDPILLNICRLLTGIATNGVFTTAFIMSMEMVTCSHRSVVGIHSSNMFAIGEVTVAGLSYFIRDWHLQCLVMSALYIPTIGFYFGIYESPRWLISNGQLEKAGEVFSQMSRMNGTKLPRTRLEETEPEVISRKKELVIKQNSLKKLFQSKVLLSRCLILAVNWAAINVVFHGLMLYAGNLGGNLYLNTVLSGLVEIPAFILLLLTLDKWGRKPLFFASMMISGFSCIASALTNIWLKDLTWLSVTFAMIGKFAISSAFSVIFNFTTEVFPTVVRNAAMGLTSSVGKFAALAAPYISQAGSLIQSEFGAALPMILFGTFTLLAGMMSLFLPETQGQSLPETIEDGENLGRTKSSMQEHEGCLNKGMDIDDKNMDADLFGDEKS